MKYLSFALVFIFLSFSGLCPKNEKLDLSNGKLASFSYSSKIHKEITRINLSNNDLDSIPSFVFKMENLRHINLSYNHLKSISEGISKLYRLRSLNLKDNNFNEIPVAVRHLRELEVLILINNPISVERYEYGKCLVNRNCTIYISNDYIEYPPYCD